MLAFFVFVCFCIFFSVQNQVIWLKCTNLYFKDNRSIYFFQITIWNFYFRDNFFALYGELVWLRRGDLKSLFLISGFIFIVKSVVGDGWPTKLRSPENNMHWTESMLEINKYRQHYKSISRCWGWKFIRTVNIIIQRWLRSRWELFVGIDEVIIEFQ